MSRIGKKEIIVPSDVEVKIDGSTVAVKGKLGELIRTFEPVIKIEKTETGIKTTPIEDTPFSRAM